MEKKKSPDITLECVSGVVAGIAGAVVANNAARDFFDKALNKIEFKTSIGDIIGVENLYKAFNDSAQEILPSQDISYFRTTISQHKQKADTAIERANASVTNFTIIAALVAGVGVAGIVHLTKNNNTPETDITDTEYDEKLIKTNVQGQNL
jgi:ABC-type antimicrobial peptide transport system permease subunit